MPERVFEIFSGRGANPAKAPPAGLQTAMGWADVFLSQLEHDAELGVWEIDLANDEVRWSRQAYAIHGLDPALGIDWDRACACYDPDDLVGLLAAYDEAVIDGELRYQATVVRPDGTRKRVKVAGHRVMVHGRGELMLGFVQDITEAHESYLKLQHLAFHDGQTGLLNRRGFDQVLLNQIQQGRPLARAFQLILLDIDNFKVINDTHGHIIGDGLLAHVARVLRQKLPQSYSIARWGGDEFAIVSPLLVSERQGEEVAKRLINALSAPCTIGGQNLKVTATCGIATSGFGLQAFEIIRRADVALCKAKAGSRGSAVRFTCELDAEHVAAEQTHNMVADALAAGRIIAEYQPILDLAKGVVIGVESLMRLYRPDGIVLPATDFLSALEDRNISWQVLDAIFDSIARDGPALQRSLPELDFVSINATQTNLCDPRFASHFLKRLSETGLAPEQIVLEVTETTLHSGDGKLIAEVLRKLQTSGVRIALDDFGTGYSSLAHLRDPPIDKIKIDSSFTRVLLSDHGSRAIVMGVLAMSRALGIEVVGEGIEDSASRDLLRALHCHHGQGYLFSPSVEIGKLASVAGAMARNAA